jgi:plasmid stability protein
MGLNKRFSKFDTHPEIQQLPPMKTTLDLPADLVGEMKLRAAQMGCKVEEVATELLKRALAPGKTISAPSADYLLAAPAGAPPMTPERVKQILEDTP